MMVKASVLMVPVSIPEEVLSVIVTTDIEPLLLNKVVKVRSNYE